MTSLHPKAVVGGLLLGLSALMLAGQHPATAANEYTVRRGDSLWGISHRLHIPLGRLIRLNHLKHTNLIRPGEKLRLNEPPPPAAPAVAPAPQSLAPGTSLTRAQAKQLLDWAAAEQNLKPSFIEAVSWRESSWNQSALSPDGAIGLMQLMPGTGDSVGKTLLHRKLNLHDARDNAEAGAALLSHYYDEFHGDKKRILAAYYQGDWGVQHYGISPAGERYADSILALQTQIEQGKPPYR